MIRIRRILNESDELIEKILKYVKSHKDDVLYPPSRIFRQMEPQGVAWLKQDGYITPRTLFRIRDDEVAQKIFEKYDVFFRQIESQSLMSVPSMAWIIGSSVRQISS